MRCFHHVVGRHIKAHVCWLHNLGGEAGAVSYSFITAQRQTYHTLIKEESWAEQRDSFCSSGNLTLSLINDNTHHIYPDFDLDSPRAALKYPIIFWGEMSVCIAQQ